MNYGVTEVFVKHDYYSNLKIKFLKEVNGSLFLLQDFGDKFKEVKEITTDKKIYTAAPNFHTAQGDLDLKYIFEDGEYSVYRYKYIMHVGSSRSSKSFSLEEAAIRQCETNSNLRVNVWRDTKESLAGTIWADFKKVFPMSGRKYSFPRNTVAIHFPNGSRIEPHGADSTNAHGTTQDIAWLNEPYKVTDEAFKQIAMRSNQVWLDLNPKERHWSDTVAKHPRCKTIHSTFMLNPFCPAQQKAEILSYDPDNPINVANGTADPYNWQVYGLGLKAEKPNRIFRNWNRMPLQAYNDLPYNEYFGLDFGKKNPTSLVGVKFNGKDEFYINPKLYAPMDGMPKGLPSVLETLIKKNDVLVVDPADKESRLDLMRNGFNVLLAKKGAGSVEGGLTLVQKFKIFYVYENVPTQNGQSLYEAFEFEYENYEWEIIKGVNLDRPIKADDHYLDGVRYIITWICKYLGVA